MLSLCQRQRIRKADAVKWLVLAGLLVVFVLDIERGDVVGQEHDFVAEEVVFVFVGQVAALDMVADEVDDKVAGAGGGVKDLDALIADGAAKFFLQDLFDAGTHKIDDLLRGVDDAVGVGLLDGKTLEEALIDGVEEALALGPGLDPSGGALDGDIEAVQRFEEFMAVEESGWSWPG